MPAIATLPILYDAKSKDFFVVLGLEQCEGPESVICAFWGELGRDSKQAGAVKELEEESLGMLSFMLSSFDNVKLFGCSTKVYVPVAYGFGITEMLKALLMKFNEITANREGVGELYLGSKVNEVEYNEIENLCYCKLDDLLKFLNYNKANILKRDGKIGNKLHYYYMDKSGVVSSSKKVRSIFCDKLVRDEHLHAYLSGLLNKDIMGMFPSIVERLSYYIKGPDLQSSMRAFMQAILKSAEDNEAVLESKSEHAGSCCDFFGWFLPGGSVGEVEKAPLLSTPSLR